MFSGFADNAEGIRIQVKQAGQFIKIANRWSSNDDDKLNCNDVTQNRCFVKPHAKTNLL